MPRSKRVKHVPPSRKRYQDSHPVLALRLPKAEYDELQLKKSESALTWLDLIHIALGKIEPLIKQSKAEGDDLNKKLTAVRKVGFQQGMDAYKVSYPCATCHKPIDVTTPRERRAIAEFMERKGWTHAECKSPSALRKSV